MLAIPGKWSGTIDTGLRRMWNPQLPVAQVSRPCKRAEIRELPSSFRGIRPSVLRATEKRKDQGISYVKFTDARPTTFES